jgi:asparagine N-glycosylation enzyme membrane subunit Stt3
VLTAPFFASNTTLVTYFFSKEIWDTSAGLIAAALIAICPGYISRSVAGSYDNKGGYIRIVVDLLLVCQGSQYGVEFDPP